MTSVKIKKWKPVKPYKVKHAEMICVLMLFDKRVDESIAWCLKCNFRANLNENKNETFTPSTVNAAWKDEQRSVYKRISALTKDDQLVMDVLE